ncbi:RNA polymerase sigma factor [Hymenobacter cheonanensis]|uniref:RNA polymerase sigma factor n=1 Tax=Hymenobacter sp. CA2-7 TaxID=3063993 RepID=UPI002712E59E|nr:sigma-70 family RNA polymerase sigma factor [Hymenobacter sp. CA2-7]MDO7888250.1 sigma-70 family RNA polymerase sigma factor [Hymenobacter sp. CA2-7]
MKTFDQALEDELVKRLYARDETAMTYFYQNYKASLYYTIWRIVRHNELAEDVLQESMLKFWLSFSEYDDSKGRLFTWALHISRNMAIDRLRGQRRQAARTTDLLQTGAELVAPTTFRPEHIGVRDWIGLLPATDQQLMHLLYIQGYTQSEASAELMLPLGTIKSRSRRLIRTLARVMR